MTLKAELKKLQDFDKYELVNCR